jgi:hypothetical protein
VIIGDKADVHRSRVQNHPCRISTSTTASTTRRRAALCASSPEEKAIALELEIDTHYAAVIEYFEIFLSRMTMMRQACEFLGCKYQLIINETQFA